MFGFLYLFGTLLGTSASGLKGAAENARLKENGESLLHRGKNPYGFYVDRKGVTRLISTGEPASIEHDYLTGDTWLCIGIPGRRTKNLSEKWRYEYYRYVKANPIPHKTTINNIFVRYKPSKNVVDFDESNWWGTWCYAYGQWFMDLRTADLYIKRRIPVRNHASMEFYMLVKNGHIVRITEFEYGLQVSNNKFDEDFLKQVIHDFNENRVMPDKNASTWEWEDFYFDHRQYMSYQSNQDELDLMGPFRPRLPV